MAYESFREACVVAAFCVTAMLLMGIGFKVYFAHKEATNKISS